jgi:hypothetical protein
MISIPVFSVYSQSRKAKRAIKKSEKAVARQENNYDKSRKDAIKHRYDIQTKEVKERMKNSKKRSDRYNRSRREPFYKDLFDKKKRKITKRRRK